MSTSDGTARAGDDYEQSSIVVEFEPRESRAVARIPIIDDLVEESIEVFTVMLSDPSEGVVGPQSEAHVSIVDNDGMFVYDSALSKL